MTNKISRTFEFFFLLFFQKFLKILLRTVLNITWKIAGPISHSFSETPRLIIGWRDQLHNTNRMRQIKSTTQHFTRFSLLCSLKTVTRRY